MATKSSTSSSELLSIKSSTSSSESLAEVTLTLLTWNINKGTFPKGVSSSGSADRRNVLIPTVLKYLTDQLGKKPDVLLLQESTIVERNAKSTWGLSNNYQQQLERSHIYQGIDTTLGVKEMDSLSKQIDKLVPEGRTDREDALKKADKDAGFPDDIIVDDLSDRRLMRSNIPSRAFARKLEVPVHVSEKETKITLITVSFHSAYKEEEKKRYIRLFFNLMCRLAHVHKCAVLIGGDFNLPVGDWNQDIESAFKGQVHVAKYTLTPHRKDLIDTFAIVYPPKTESVEHILGEPTVLILIVPRCDDDQSEVGRDLIVPLPTVNPPKTESVEHILGEPTAVYPFPDYTRGENDQFMVVRFTDQKKEELEKLLLDKGHITSRGKPDLKILKYDLDHDPVLVTVTLCIKKTRGQ